MEILNPIWSNNWLDPPGREQKRTSHVVQRRFIGNRCNIPSQINTADLNIIGEHGLRLVSELRSHYTLIANFPSAPTTQEVN